jgi:hypothetical protein
MTVFGERIVLQNQHMIYRTIKRSLLLLAIGINSLCAGPARAALGGDAAGVLTDAAELRGVVNSEIRQQFDIQEIDADSGMRVREFLNHSGVVFAVSWSGPVLPNMQQLLGAHYAEYSIALAALSHPGLRRSLRVASSEVVVEAGGHLRAYAGRAYLPALIPAGVSVADLR